MALIKSSNPALSEKAFRKEQTVTDQGAMTIGGAINKSFDSIIPDTSTSFVGMESGSRGCKYATLYDGRHNWRTHFSNHYHFQERMGTSYCTALCSCRRIISWLNQLYFQRYDAWYCSSGNRFNLCCFLYDAFPL